MASTVSIQSQVMVIDGDNSTTDSFQITVPPEYAGVAERIEFTGDRLQDGAMWATLRGLGQLLLGQLGGSTPAVPPPAGPIQNLAQAFFGLPAGQAVTREQLAVLKALGLITQDTSSMAWSLTKLGSTCAGLAGLPPASLPKPFLASVNMFLVKNEDLDAAATSIPSMFTATGFAPKPGTTPPSNYTAADVERVARSLYTKLQGDTSFDLRDAQSTSLETKAIVAKMVAQLLGLPAGTSWDALTAEQVNTAIACGLLSFDPQQKTLVLTVNGASYVRSKVTADTAPPGGVPAAAPNSEKAFWDSLKYFYENGGILFADYAEWEQDHDSADNNNGRFGGMGINLLANATTDSPIWGWCGLGHLSTDQRQALINSAKVIDSGPSAYVQHEVSSFGDAHDASDFDKRTFTAENIKGWLMANQGDWYGSSIDSVKQAFANPNHPTSIVYDQAAFLATPDVQQKLDLACEKLFGKKFSAMSVDEQRRALDLLVNTYPIFYYTPPEYADALNPATGQTERAIIKPGQLYFREGAVLPGTASVGDPPGARHSNRGGGGGKGVGGRYGPGN